MTTHEPDLGSEPPKGIDTTVAHSARIWNYWLDGKDHYASDREVGDRVFEMFPDIIQVARADRRFLIRAVRFLAGEAKIRQFLDIGTGLPTADNTHQVAQRLAPDSRVVYVDNDPVVMTHARALLTSSPEGGLTDYIEADARDTDTILSASARTLDFTRPVAVMLLGLLNFIPDTEEAQSIANRLMAAIPPGSYLAISHPTHDIGDGSNVEAMRFWNEHAKPPIRGRSRQDMAAFFDGLRLLEPGIVACSHWRPDPGDSAMEVAQFGAVGYKPPNR